jgi:hypothetical protein
MGVDDLRRRSEVVEVAGGVDRSGEGARREPSVDSPRIVLVVGGTVTLAKWGARAAGATGTHG